MSILTVAAADSDWLPRALAALERDGCALVSGVLDAKFLERTRAALYRVRYGIAAEIGEERLCAAGEIGTYRIPFRYDPHFYAFLQLAQPLAVVDQIVGSAAILHLLNGFILPPQGQQAAIQAFALTYHRDFPRYLNGYAASINAFFAIDDFTEENGATMVVPGSHQRAAEPDAAEIASRAEPALGAAGTMLLFDSTLWHAAGQNRSGGDRLAVNMQFTRSWIKQQIDYVRALGEDAVLAQPARVQQLLGWYTRVVTSLDEFYRPEDARLYRRHQG